MVNIWDKFDHPCDNNQCLYYMKDLYIHDKNVIKLYEKKDTNVCNIFNGKRIQMYVNLIVRNAIMW